MGSSQISAKSIWDIEEAELPLPDNHEEVSIAADDLLAEMLIRYYMEKKSIDNKGNYGKLLV
ncbi:MAG: hypothetical protein V1682_02400 [Candidatus Omnitrophota bacterium]